MNSLYEKKYCTSFKKFIMIKENGNDGLIDSYTEKPINVIVKQIEDNPFIVKGDTGTIEIDSAGDSDVLDAVYISDDGVDTHIMIPTDSYKNFKNGSSDELQCKVDSVDDGEDTYKKKVITMILSKNSDSDESEGLSVFDEDEDYDIAKNSVDDGEEL